ncbi:MAG TPA: hypothetical protein VJ672_13540 [Gemmatimonadaceae bacterium]|nr:hypothetical protein [Gemmatimonadaceae bacterium]
MSDELDPLEVLYARLDARTDNRVRSDTWAAHAAVLDRLAANIRIARARGWKSCAVERVERVGRFNGWGVPPGHSERHPVPDWGTERDGADGTPDGD